MDVCTTGHVKRLKILNIEIVDSIVFRLMTLIVSIIHTGLEQEHLHCQEDCNIARIYMNWKIIEKSLYSRFLQQ